MLDLEGNGVEDLGQVRYLQLCPRLATLTLEGNLVCLRPRPSDTVRVVGAGEAALCGSGPWPSRGQGYPRVLLLFAGSLFSRHWRPGSCQ